MPETVRTKIPYPGENDAAWWGAWQSLMSDLDAKLYAAREDRNTILEGGGVMSFDAGTGVLAWADALRLFSFENAFAWYLEAGNATLQDGQVLYAVLPRGIEQSTVVLPTVGDPPLPSTVRDTGVVVCHRVGARVYFRNGAVLQDGDAWNIIERGGTLSTGSLLPTSGLGYSQL